MNPELDAAVTAHADLGGLEFDALIATADDCPQFAPGFLAWVQHVDVQGNRRQELDYPLQLPDAAINPTGTAGSISRAAVSGRCHNAGSIETPHGPVGHCWSPAVHAHRTLGT
jgi:hypothetical protein